MKISIKNVEDMEEFAKSFVKEILQAPAEKNHATVVGLQGDLGAGKTTFAKSVAKALGVTNVVTSPTFVIEKIYKLANISRFARFIHIDAYRLNGGEELSAIGWEHIENDPENLILIEWPEMVSDILPGENEMRILKFKFVSEQEREVEY